jgi:hypothetical protein
MASMAGTPEKAGRNSVNPNSSIRGRRWLSLNTFVLMFAAAGYRWREGIPFHPRDGIGYWLGITGGTMMLLLLVYPLRKRVEWRMPGSMGLWFRFHMLMGVLGPLAVLYHARFTYRAINSGVALFAMLVVVGSGLIGRYLHIHIYRGHTLRHVEAGELLDEARVALSRLDADGDSGDVIHAELVSYVERAGQSRDGILASLRLTIELALLSAIRRRALARAIAAHFAEAAPANGWDAAELARHQQAARRHLRRFFGSVRDAAAYAVFDRLFALWHHLHLPLFGFLVVAAITHVVAVHVY